MQPMICDSPRPLEYALAQDGGQLNNTNTDNVAFMEPLLPLHLEMDIDPADVTEADADSDADTDYGPFNTPPTRKRKYSKDAATSSTAASSSLKRRSP